MPSIEEKDAFLSFVRKNSKLMCKVFISFDGTGTVSIKDSVGVADLVDNGGLGDYTINFSRDFLNTNYCVTFGGESTLPNSRAVQISIHTKLVGSLRIRTAELTAVPSLIFADLPEINIQVFGE